MSVERVWEAPRVTKPYTEAQWTEIEKLGHADRRAAARGRRAPHDGRRAHVRVGRRSGWRRNGTPTALGPEQAPPRHRAVQPAQEEIRAAGPVAFRPGQVVSRASNCRAGRSTASGAATASRSGRTRRCSTTRSTDRGVNAGRRGLFLAGVAERLGLPPEYVFAAFEDAFYYLWRERRLPANVDPFKSKLEDAVGARAAGARVRAGSRRGRRPRPAGRRAMSPARAGGPATWFLRRERCYLIPGDSPLGLSAAARFAAVGEEEDYPYTSEPDPMAPPSALPTRGRDPPPVARDGDPRREAGGDASAARKPRDGVVAPRQRACRADLRRPRSRAPPCAPSRATARSTSSCRPPTRSRITSSSSPRSKRPPRP